MHELSIARAIVDTALRHADGGAVKQVNVRVGALRQVVPDWMPFYFEIAARGTDCEGARLELEPVDAVLRCAACERQWDPAPDPAIAWPLVPFFRCPVCGAAGAETIAGDELQVASIEVEEQLAGSR